MEAQPYDDLRPVCLHEVITSGQLLLLDRHNDLIATFASHLEREECIRIVRLINGEE